jgi:ABC-type siderophore export system fused ATPase/permease subunit
VSIPIAVVTITIALVQIPQTSPISLLTYICYVVLYIAANVVLALGLSFVNPEFSDKAREQMIRLMVNAQVAAFTSIGLFITSALILDLDIFITLLLQTFVVCLLGLIVIYVGKKRLEKIE